MSVDSKAEVDGTGQSLILLWYLYLHFSVFVSLSPIPIPHTVLLFSNAAKHGY